MVSRRIKLARHMALLPGECLLREAATVQPWGSCAATAMALVCSYSNHALPRPAAAWLDVSAGETRLDTPQRTATREAEARAVAAAAAERWRAKAALSGLS
jgi:hypothetical protein